MRWVIPLLGIILLTGCLPKIEIDKVEKPYEASTPEICRSSFGMIVFKDKRVNKKIDSLFDQDVNVVLTQELISNLNYQCPKQFELLDNEGSDASSGEAHKILESRFDYVLSGEINSFTVETYDKYRGARMAGAVVAGLTAPIGFVALPVLSAGDVELIVDVEIDNLSLVDVKNSTIVWQGTFQKKQNEKVSAVKVGVSLLEDKVNEIMPQFYQHVYQNISLSLSQDTND